MESGVWTFSCSDGRPEAEQFQAKGGGFPESAEVDALAEVEAALQRRWRQAGSGCAAGRRSAMCSAAEVDAPTEGGRRGGSGVGEGGWAGGGGAAVEVDATDVQRVDEARCATKV